MTTQEIANRLVELCRSGKWEQALDELYSPDAVSIEPEGGPWPSKTVGRKAIDAKGERWNSMVEEVYGFEVTDPIVCGEQFSLGMTMDIKMKGTERSKSPEICVYEVRNEKIVKEQFFYPLPEMPA